jgi:D-beta-D-heptose 7-phosphate kinase/D-beta-D-heptose 1-phosphate adenosyltransferase
MYECVNDFGARTVLVIGDAILDEYMTGECSRLSPEAPVPVLRVSDVRHVAGGAANTAANVASLGGRVRLVSIIGDDPAGAHLKTALRQACVEFEAFDGGRPTIRKTRVIGQNQQLVRLDYEGAGPVAPDAEARLLRAFERAVASCDIVVLSDYAKGAITPLIARRVIELAHDCAKPVVVDPRPQHGHMYRGCDYLTPNWKEGHELLAWHEEPQVPSRIEEVGRALAAKFDCNVLLTLGAGGIAFFGRDGAERFSVPGLAKEVFDVSGAGDTLLAAFAIARAAAASNRDAVALANKAASIVVGKLGTATVTRDELINGKSTARLVSRAELGPLSQEIRAKGNRIVTVNGSFDLLHAGHLYILTEAKKQGDVLIVGLNSDASVRRYKGASRPIVPEAHRAEMLLALRMVDYVHIFDESDPIEFLEHVCPAVHVNGAEYGETCVEAETLVRLKARLHLVDRLPGLSTTKVLDTLVAR